MAARHTETASVQPATPGTFALAHLAGRIVHFVGIGGCGMSGLAHMVAAAGAKCSGSDLASTPTVQALSRVGIPVSLRQTADSVPEQAELIVISAAIGDDHPEVRVARGRGLPILKYADMLGQVMRGRTGVAVAGTHGKSSTTSLLSHVLIQTGRDPSVIVGAQCPQVGGGHRVGTSDLLVAEACEFDRSFHRLHPTHAVILNVEHDHLDVYPTFDDVVEAFAVFARHLPCEGSLLIQHEAACRMEVTAGLDCAVATLGFAPQADWQVVVQREPPHGPAYVELHHEEQKVAAWTAPLPGEHMAYNAAAAAVVAHRLHAPWSDIARAIESFKGLDRRMQRLDDLSIAGGRVRIVDDYGHHPTEIDTTLRALRQYYAPARVICVFQPHQHSRTRFLLDAFAASFHHADVVIVPDIYFVRDSEKEREAVSSRDLVERLREMGVDASHVPLLDDIAPLLLDRLKPNDLLVTMGAGDVWKVAHRLLGR